MFSKQHSIALMLLLAVPATWASTVVPAESFTRISPGNAGVGGLPAIAGDGSQFLVGYQVPGASGGYDIYAARVSAAGALTDASGIAVSTGGNVDSNGAQQLPSVLFDGTNFIVAWSENKTSAGSGYEIYAARVTPGGTVLDPGGVKLTTGAEPLRAPGMAFDGTNLLLVWREGPSSPPFGVWGLIVSKTLSVVTGGPRGFSISTTGRYPFAAFDGTNYFVVWHDERNSNTTGLDIYGARVSKSGVVLDPAGIPICNAAENQDHSSVAFNGTTYLVSWWDDRGGDRWNEGSARAARVLPDGTVSDPGGIVLGNYARNQPPVVTSSYGDGFLVVWMTDSGPGDYRLVDTLGRRVNRDGTLPESVPFDIGASYGHQWAPTIAANGTNALVVWNESQSHSRCVPNCVYGTVAALSAAPSAIITESTSVSAQADPAPWIDGASPTSQHLYTVWATDSGNVFAAGEYATVVHYDGSAWTTELGFDFRWYALWGMAPDDMWVGGWCGSTWHRAAARNWAPAPGCQGASIALGIWGANRSNPQLVGAGGYAKEYTAGRWEDRATGVNTDLRDLWGTSANSVYAVGERGRVMHWNGSTWSAVANVPTAQSLNGVWGTGESDIFVVGDGGLILHSNGGAWSAQASGTTETLNAVWGFSSQNVYAVGQHGTILHYDGNSWTAEASGTVENLTDVVAIGPDVWAVGEVGTIRRKSVVAPPPVVTSIGRIDPNPTADPSVRFTVSFNMPVTGVDASDFAIVASGVTATSIASVTGTGAQYIVTVSTGSGSTGTIRLDLNDNDSIVSAAAAALGGSGSGNGNFTGETYDVDRSPTLSAPTGVTATAISISQIEVTWNLSPGATQYEVWRLINNSYVFIRLEGGPPITDNVSPGTTHVYKVRAMASGRSPFGVPDLATTIAFMDDPIAAGSTSIRFMHVYELRQAIAAVRTAAGLSIPTWIFIEPYTAIYAAHVQQLRDALTAGRASLGIASAAYTDSVLTPQTTRIKAVHFQELRDRVK